MIISDKYRFVFIHIPKCAGTSIRKRLQDFDERSGAFTDRIDEHPVLGSLDFVHIPLFVLSDHFPIEYECVKRYWSFSIVRDPFQRFASSVSQRLEMHSNIPIQQRSSSEIVESIEHSMAYLASQPGVRHRLPPEFIHFQKQVDYVDLDGERIVDDVFPIARIDALFDAFSARTGISLTPDKDARVEVSRANASRVYPNEPLRVLARAVRPLTQGMNRLLPSSLMRTIYDKVTVPRDLRLREIFEREHVKNFVRQYYADDIYLYQQVKLSHGVE